METQQNPVKRITAQPLSGTGRLGKEIRISPKAHINIMNPGYRTEYFVPTIEICIGIGKNNTAELIMTTEAWEALRSGEEINIYTTEEYKKKYVYKIRK